MGGGVESTGSSAMGVASIGAVSTKVVSTEPVVRLLVGFTIIRAQRLKLLVGKDEKFQLVVAKNSKKKQ